MESHLSAQHPLIVTIGLTITSMKLGSTQTHPKLANWGFGRCLFEGHSPARLWNPVKTLGSEWLERDAVDMHMLVGTTIEK